MFPARVKPYPCPYPDWILLGLLAQIANESARASKSVGMNGLPTPDFGATNRQEIARLGNSRMPIWLFGWNRLAALATVPTCGNEQGAYS